MSWLELDDRILEHPKFIRAVKLAGSDAIHLWLGFRAYCGQNLTNGRVPADMLDEVRGPKDPKRRKASLDALLAVGLLDPLAGGDVQMHNFLKWSSSRDAVLERREKARARKQRSREPGAGSHAVTDAEPSEDSKRPAVGSHGGVNAQSQTPAGASPLPLPSTPSPPPDRKVAMADSELPIADRARKVLENPNDGLWLQPSKWPEVQRGAVALGIGIRDLKLTDFPPRDSDLKAILELYRDGYTVEQLEELGIKARASAFVKSKKNVGPAFFTAAVARRLMSESGEPEQIELQ